MQAPSQLRSLLPRHPHTPASQTSLVPQVTPQAPQLLVSVWVATHRSPQTRCPTPQLQPPATQDAPVGQRSLHAPQCARLV